MYKTELSLNQSNNSLNNSYTYCMPTTIKILNLKPHQLAIVTWLTPKDPQLACKVYVVYIIYTLWIILCIIY